MGIVVPMIIAFLRRCSCPLISFLSSGIEVKPRRANITTPIGVMKLFMWIGIRLCGWIEGENLINIPRTIEITAMTPHVSIFLRPFSPSRNRSVMTNQKIIPKRIGGMSGAINWERDCPSPIK